MAALRGREIYIVIASSTLIVASCIANGLWLFAGLVTVTTLLAVASSLVFSSIFSLLDPATDKELHTLLRSAPTGVGLVDRETGTILVVKRERLITTVTQTTADSVEEAIGDFDAGHMISSLPSSCFVYRRGSLSRLDTPITIRPSEDDVFEGVMVEPPKRRWAATKFVWFAARTGVTKASAAAAAELVGQLRRAEPVPDTDDDLEDD